MSNVITRLSRMNNEIFLQLRSDLSLFLYKKMGNDEATDAIQEVYLRWQKLDLSNVKNPRAFLFTMALNIVRDKTRHQAIKLEYAVAVQDFHYNEYSIDEPALHYDEQTQLKRLLQALNQLPDQVAT